jgi:hypothetical protein
MVETATTPPDNLTPSTWSMSTVLRSSSISHICPGTTAEDLTELATIVESLMVER